MEIFFVPMFIALAVFPNSVELIRRLPPPQPRFPAPVAGQGMPGQATNHMPTGLYNQAAGGILHPLPRGSALIERDNFYIGRLIRGYVVPLYNSAGRIVKQEKFNDVNQIEIGPEGAARFGIPGYFQEVLARMQRDYRMREFAANEARRAAAQQARERSSQNGSVRPSKNV